MLRSLCLLTFSGVLLFSCGQVRGQFGGPTRVEIATVVESSLAPTVSLVGTIHPQRRTTVAAEVWGFVVEMPVDRGDFVKKGDLLCKLRDTQHRFGLNEAAARTEDLKAMVAVAQAELVKAEFEDRRIRALSDTAEKERVDAAANLDAAKARVRQAEAALTSAEAIRERMADLRQRTEVRAPFDGYVVAKLTEVGSWVVQGGGVVEMVDLSTARIRLNVPEAYIEFNEIGTEAVVHVDSLKRDFGGRIARVVPDADQQARTFPMDVDIPNPDGLLRAGMFVRGSVPSGPRGRQLVIPKDAVVTRGSGNFVFVVRKSSDGAMAEMKPVTVISEVLDRVAVDVPGLAEGDEVVVRGNEGMYSPGPVIVMEPSKPSTESGKEEANPTSKPSGSNSITRDRPGESVESARSE